MVVESVVLIVAIILAVLVFLRFIPLNLWISALASGVHVSIFTLMGMRIRRVPPAKIVGPLIKAEKAGLNMQISKMEAHFLAGGNLDRVITALITARGANIKLDFPEACAIDLAGRGDDRCARRRGHRHDRRLCGDAQGRAGKPGSDQPHRAEQGA